jgi:hypothetical protein
MIRRTSSASGGKGMPRHAHEKFEAEHYHDTEKPVQLWGHTKVFPELRYYSSVGFFRIRERIRANHYHGLQYASGYRVHAPLWGAGVERISGQSGHRQIFPSFVVGGYGGSAGSIRILIPARR